MSYINNYIDITSAKSIKYIYGRIDPDDHEVYGFKEVLDDFTNAKYVRIATFNITEPKKYDYLLDTIYKLDENKDIKLIVNLPDKSIEKIEKYLKLLDPLNFKGRPQISINIHNHSKIIGTENLVYIGSQNFSYGSRNNYEAGVVIKDKEVVEKIFKSFDEIFNNGIYYGSDQVKKIISIIYKVENLEKILKAYKESLKFDEEEISYLDSYDLESYYEYINESYYELDKGYSDLCKEIETTNQESINLCLEKLRDLSYYIESLKLEEYSYDMATLIEKNKDDCGVPIQFAEQMEQESGYNGALDEIRENYLDILDIGKINEKREEADKVGVALIDIISKLENAASNIDEKGKKEIRVKAQEIKDDNKK